MDDRKWEELIKEADENGDGKLTYDEFKNAIKSFLDQIYDTNKMAK